MRSTNGSVTGLSLVKRMKARPSARRCTDIRAPASAGLYSNPAALNASGNASDVLSDAASSALMSRMSISARNGSPSADCTVIRPSASALAFDPERPNNAATKDARAVLRQRCD